MHATVRAIISCKAGASAAEYALILGLICTVIAIGATSLGTAIAAPLTNASTALTP